MADAYRVTSRASQRACALTLRLMCVDSGFKSGFCSCVSSSPDALSSAILLLSLLYARVVERCCAQTWSAFQKLAY